MASTSGEATKASKAVSATQNQVQAKTTSRTVSGQQAVSGTLRRQDEPASQALQKVVAHSTLTHCSTTQNAAHSQHDIGPNPPPPSHPPPEKAGSLPAAQWLVAWAATRSEKGAKITHMARPYIALLVNTFKLSTFSITAKPPIYDSVTIGSIPLLPHVESPRARARTHRTKPNRTAPHRTAPNTNTFQLLQNRKPNPH